MEKVLDECFFHDSLRAKDVGVILAGVLGGGRGAHRRYLKKYKLPEKTLSRNTPGHENEAGSLAAAPAHRPRLLILTSYRGAGPGGAG